MVSKDFNSLFELFSAFPDEQSCIDHLEELRWGGVVISPFDPTSKVYKCKDNKYRCKNTGKYFNVKTNTLFDGTKIELRKWFAAIWIVTSHKRHIFVSIITGHRCHAKDRVVHVAAYSELFRH